MKEHPQQDKKSYHAEESEKNTGMRSMAPPAFSLSTGNSIQAKLDEEGEGKEMGTQFKTDIRESEMPPDVEGSANSGNGLPGAIQAKMENSLGGDFSNVNIHKNSSEATDAGALAFTQGNDIHFAPGQFKMDNSGQELLGHELAHVQQQRAGRVRPTTESANGMLINDDSGLEKEADVMGSKAARGEPTQYKSAGLGMRNSMQSSIQAKMAPVQMKVDTHFAEWHDDTYDLYDTGGLRGADINLRFKPKEGVDAELIGLTQTIKMTKNNSPYYMGSATREDHSITNADAETISGVSDEGTHIDQADHNRSPLYAVEGAPAGDANLKDTLPVAGDATGENTWGKHAFRYHQADGTLKEQDGILKDTPKLSNADTNSGQIFEVTALAIIGKQKDTYYGSVEWGWETDAAGTHKLLPLKAISEGVPSASFMKAAEAWNASQTNAGVDTLNLPTVDVKVATAPITQALPDDFVGPPMQLPTGTRLQIVTPSVGDANGVVRVVDGDFVGYSMDVSAADMANIEDERG